MAEASGVLTPELLYLRMLVYLGTQGANFRAVHVGILSSVGTQDFTRTVFLIVKTKC